MKNNKRFLFVGLVFAFISGSFGADKTGQTEVGRMEERLQKLKDRFPVIQNHKYPEGYPLPTDDDFNQMEKALGVSLPQPLKMFYQAVGNLSFQDYDLARPNGGKESPLYNLIREGERKKIPLEWFSFCKDGDNEAYFCIHKDTDKVCRFVFHPTQKDEEFQDLSVWIEKIWFSE